MHNDDIDDKGDGINDDDEKNNNNILNNHCVNPQNIVKF
jgi:hypothetical protein